MKYILSILLIVVQLSASSQTKKVCFLGNSYTYVNDLPTFISNIALANGDTLIKDQNTPGGYTLNGHSTNVTSIAKVASQDWGYVVLQEQSQLPSFPYQQVQTDVLPYAKVLCDTIRYFNTCAKPLFFNTWGRRDGDPQWDSIDTFSEMNERLYNTYNYMADVNSGIVSPVGKAFEYINNDPSAQVLHYDLYSSDGSHPSIYGSYLAAAVFYQIIFEDSIVGNTFTPSGISSTEKSYLQMVAQYVVRNNPDPLDYTQPIASFSYTISGDTVFFTNESQHELSWSWSFGDGDTSTLENPMHVFQNGTFQVTLTASYCTNSDDSSQTIEMMTRVNEYENSVQVYPNPVVDGIFIKTTTQELVVLYDINGRLVHSFKSNSYQLLDVPKGIYFIKISNELHKVIKL